MISHLLAGTSNGRTLIRTELSVNRLKYCSLVSDEFTYWSMFAQLPMCTSFIFYFLFDPTSMELEEEQGIIGRQISALQRYPFYIPYSAWGEYTLCLVCACVGVGINGLIELFCWRIPISSTISFVDHNFACQLSIVSTVWLLWRLRWICCWLWVLDLGAWLQLFFSDEKNIEGRSRSHRWIGIRPHPHSQTHISQSSTHFQTLLLAQLVIIISFRRLFSSSSSALSFVIIMPTEKYVFFFSFAMKAYGKRTWIQARTLHAYSEIYDSLCR